LTCVSCVDLKATRNGLRVGDLVGDFGVFTDRWVAGKSLCREIKQILLCRRLC